MPPAPDAWGERLPRHLGLWSSIAVLVGSTIGSGIFRVPAGVAARLEEPGPVVLAWVLGGLIALFGALTYAELAGLALLAFTAGSGSAAHFTPLWSSGVSLSVLSTALIAIMWTYDGWADLSFMGGEVKDPGRTLPRALILGTSGIVVVYLLLNF